MLLFQLLLVVFFERRGAEVDEDSPTAQEYTTFTEMSVPEFPTSESDTEEPPATGKPSGLSGGAIAGIVIGSVALVAIVVGIVVILIKRKQLAGFRLIPQTETKD
jgi:hypothetical protein